MSQSTPIFNIQRDMQQNDQSRAIQNLIDDNVDEMQQYEPSVDQAYQLQQQVDNQNYQNQQFPQQQMQMPQQMQMTMPIPPSGFSGQSGSANINPNLYVPTQMRGQMMGPADYLGNVSSQGQGHQQSNSDDWYTYLMKEFKDSLIIAVLFVLLNISIVQKLLQLYIPYMDNAYLELIVRGLISGGLFYFVRRFWKP